MYTPEDLLKLMNATGYRTQEEIAEAVDVTDRTVRYWLTIGWPLQTRHLRPLLLPRLPWQT